MKTINNVVKRNPIVKDYVENTRKIKRRQPIHKGTLDQVEKNFAYENQLALNSENYLRDESHINLVEFAHSYIPTNLEGRRNIFTLPSTTFSLPFKLESTRPDHITDYFTFVEQEQGQIFSACKLMSTAYNTVDLYNDSVKNILHKLTHDYFHFMFLDYVGFFSSAAEELFVILENDILKQGGRISLTCAHRNDMKLLNWWKSCDAYRKPNTAIGEYATKLAIIYFIESSFPDRYKVLEAKSFDKVTNLIIEKL